MKHFLKETDFTLQDAHRIFTLAHTLKKARMQRPLRPLAHQSWGMIFYKKSTRTRVSFQVGLQELGADVVINTASDMQLTRGETEEDTARVLARYLHGLIIRCFSHETLHTFAEKGQLPVVNALSDFLHPCQIYTDLFTLAEIWSPAAPSPDALRGRKIAFFGDTACNVANSILLGGAMFGMQVALSGPKEFAPGEAIREQLRRDGLPLDYTFTTDPAEAARDADVLYTDVWVSMGKEEEEQGRIATMRPYTVTSQLLETAKPDALFMHCLPAHPGLEVEAEVLNHPRSIIFDQAENRLHVQKGILTLLAEYNSR